MIAWLLAALDRVPPSWRRVAVGAAALLVLAAAITALILEARPVGRHHRPGPGPGPGPAPVARRPRPSVPTPRTARPPVSATELGRATDVAERFAVSYLRFTYGRATASSVVDVAPSLRSQLIRGRAPVTPIERQRHPRLVSLHTVATMPGFVVATATVEDGGARPASASRTSRRLGTDADRRAMSTSRCVTTCPIRRWGRTTRRPPSSWPRWC